MTNLSVGAVVRDIGAEGRGFDSRAGLIGELSPSLRRFIGAVFPRR